MSLSVSTRSSVDEYVVPPLVSNETLQAMGLRENTQVKAVEDVPFVRPAQPVRELTQSLKVLFDILNAKSHSAPSVYLAQMAPCANSQQVKELLAHELSGFECVLSDRSLSNEQYESTFLDHFRSDTSSTSLGSPSMSDGSSKISYQKIWPYFKEKGFTEENSSYEAHASPKFGPEAYYRFAEHNYSRVAQDKLALVGYQQATQLAGFKPQSAFWEALQASPLEAKQVYGLFKSGNRAYEVK